eukprot:TRINITY_DN55793_c0_g1_i1.p1 TRINITY_DN55793_c0_g1~~TRINITY_DN55793_c0_g1_i1.p1  ORF type:complete len:306 (+),score=82.71 TRINITY_DN55793_c0_g1_i1:137-919(+)
MSAVPLGYRKVGRVFFVNLLRYEAFMWNQEVKLAALQLGLTQPGKTICLPDLPQYRDLLLLVMPWVAIDARTTDEVKEMLGVPHETKWQELRDNMAPPEEPYIITTHEIVKERQRFMRELDWLKQEMREKLRIQHEQPGDRQAEGRTLFCFDDVTKEWWKLWTKNKLRKDRRWARFTPTPAGGFNDPSARDAISVFFPRNARGDTEMELHTRAIPMLGWTRTRMWTRQHPSQITPLRKLFGKHADKIVPKGSMARSTTFW